MKKIEIRLTNQHSPASASCGLYLRGTMFADGVMHRTPEEIAKRLPQSGMDVKAWGEAIAKLNGYFALVWQHQGQVVAAVDRIRSIPLFYGERSGLVFISDDAEWVRKQVGDIEMAPVARDEFQLTGYVTGNETLYPNVKQLQAGELLAVDDTEASPALTTYRYFRYLHTEPAAYDEPILRQSLENYAQASVKRLIDYAAGRQIVIPLSGGYDSRFIATLLARLGYKKTLAFSYGVKGNKEAAYSRQVAQALGLAWHFVEYSSEHWRNAWNTEQRRQYQKWASGCASLPHIQDWVAVYTLQADGIIDRDCVFAPGHTSNRPYTGIPDDASPDHDVGIATFVERILQKHYSRSVGKSGPDANRSIWKERIIDCAEVTEIGSKPELASAFERWEWQERQAKFICNSVRVYEFFGYDWWLPLWDAELIQFSQTLPLSLRQGRRWYNDCVKRLYASQAGIDAKKTLANAADIGFFGKTIRAITARFPAETKDYLKALRYTLAPKRMTNAYFVSHLSAVEIKRLQREGYRADGMLVHEFLKSYQ